MPVAGKPERSHWRSAEQPQAAVPSGKAYAPSVRAHCETVQRSFYDYHLEAGTGPIVNPFPLDRSRRGGRANAHHNPMEPFRKERAGRYRPRVPSRVPRSVPDEEFNEIFARLPSHRDRALVAFYVSTGALVTPITEALHASGILAAVVAVGLLSGCGSWLHRDDFTSQFITMAGDADDGAILMAALSS